jgi:predicted alpha/beta-fold hydrolase
MKPKTRIGYKKECLKEKNLEGVTLTWCFDSFNDHKSDILVFILPGLTGTPEDTYINALVTELIKVPHFKCVIYNYRLFSKELIICKERKISLVEDLDSTFAYIGKNHPQYKVSTVVY